jgi:hypothetical protein
MKKYMENINLVVALPFALPMHVVLVDETLVGGVTIPLFFQFQKEFQNHHQEQKFRCKTNEMYMRPKARAPATPNHETRSAGLLSFSPLLLKESVHDKFAVLLRT